MVWYGMVCMGRYSMVCLIRSCTYKYGVSMLYAVRAGRELVWDILYSK